MLGSVIKFVVLATLLTALIILSSPPVITKTFAWGYPYARAYGWPYPMRFGPTFKPHQLAHQHGWGRQRYATPVVHRFHEARRTNDSLKQHQAELPDQKPVQSVGTRTSLDTHPRGNDDATAVKPLVNRSPDEVQVAPLVERKAEQTIGRAPVHAPADAVQIAPPSAIEACRGRREAWPCTAVLPDRHNGLPE